MKYVIRAAPILVALALFVSFLAIQQGRPAQANHTVTGLSLSVTPGIRAGTVTNPSHVSSNVNLLMASRTVTVIVTDADTVMPIVTIKNDTSGISTTTVVAPGPTWTGTFAVIDSTEAGVFVGGVEGTEVAAEDGDLIRVTAGFLLVEFTVDSDPPDMNEANMVPADGAISGDGLTPMSGKVTDDGAGVAEEDIFLDVNGTDIPASLVSFTELEDEGGHSYSTFINVADGAHTYQSRAVDGAGNAAFSDSDEDTVCVVKNGIPTPGVLTATLCEANDFNVDTEPPSLSMAFTGLAFDVDESDCDPNSDPPGATCDLLENKRDWIMAVFTDPAPGSNDLDGNSIDLLDFLVDGEAPKTVKWFDEAGEVNNVADSGPWDIRKLVFIQLDDELAADATPEVNLVALAGGVADEALNINNSDTSGDSKDRIGPLFETSNFLPVATSAILAGEDVEVTFTITADEETDTKPAVVVRDVFSPASGLGTTVTSAGTNKWSVVIDDAAGGIATIFNIHISGEDTSGNSADLGIKNVDVKDPANLDDSDSPGVNEADGIIDGFFGTITDSDICVKGSTTTTCVLLSNFSAADIDEDAIYFEGDTADLAAPVTVPAEDASSDERSPFFISLDFSSEGDEFEEDDHAKVELLIAELDGVDVLASASTADDKKWLIAVLDIALGEHELVINASDQAGNDLADAEFKLEFEVTERAPIEVGLNPGWNLVSLPGQPSNASIDAVMANTPDATAVITYDPTIPGGFLVAVRDPGATFAGTLKTMDANRGYWVLTDSFVPIEVDVPPLAAGSAGVLPPTIAIAKGWNLVPIQDPTGAFGAGDLLDAAAYFTSAEDVSAVYFFDTIANAWEFVDLAPAADATVEVGRAYWVFSSAAGSLVPVPVVLVVGVP